jgi:hypothetical protein
VRVKIYTCDYFGAVSRDASDRGVIRGGLSLVAAEQALDVVREIIRLSFLVVKKSAE